MDPMKPTVMIKQVADLPNMMRTQVPIITQRIREVLSHQEALALERVVIVGDGDSYHAALAAEMAFENIAKTPCEPMSAMRFLEYGVDFIPGSLSKETLVVGISASGKTQRVIQSLEKAGSTHLGMPTLALTGGIDSPLAAIADKTVYVNLPDMGASPGIRTYNATLLGLILLAIYIGESKKRFSLDGANIMRQELKNLADIIEASVPAMDAVAQEMAGEFIDAGQMLFLGSGPSYGTATFSAAKIIEAAGIFSVGQDLEEWAHVERFAYPDNMPTFIIAPPGRSTWRALDLAGSAHSLGRRIVAIVHQNDLNIASQASYVFRIAGDMREEFSTLVYHLPVDLFASYLAEKQGKHLFQSDRTQ